MRRVCAAKVARLTLGDLPTCLVLLPSKGGGMGWQKSAEAVVAAKYRRGEGLNL
jgi:RNA-directed DNA polymerase